MTYQIDGIDLNPQAVEHTWEYPTVLGHDGRGRPIYAKYNSVVIRCSIDIHEHFWFDDWFISSIALGHNISVPRPGTSDDFTTYTGVYIDYIRDGVVLRKSGMRGVELRFLRVEV